MARGENQGLQIAVIIFVLVALILGVSTFFLFQKYDAEKQKTAAAEDKAFQASKETASIKKDRDELKVVIGLGEGASMESIRTALGNDMKKYAPALPEGKKDYRSAIAFLDTSVQRAAEAKSDEIIKVAALTATNDARERIKDPQIEKHKKQQDDAEVELKQESEKFTANAKGLQDQLASTTAAASKTQQDLEADKKKLSTDLQTVKKDLVEVTTKNTQSAGRLKEFTAKTSTVPDGRIVWVDQRTRMAWIDLGKEDNLPRQQTFSVHPSGTVVMADEGAEGSTKKASIEVVKITGAHMAEVRILDFDVSNPVMAGDKIFTPSWHPGRKQHFAIAGLTDINGDGTDDRAQLKDIIALSGGVIDMEVLADGTKAGPGVSLDTTYFIRGGIPKSTSADDVDAQKVAKGMSEVENEARNHGARVISLEQFLDDIGYFNRERIFRAGSGDEYNLKQGIRNAAGAGVSRGSTSELFKKREAPTSKKGGAFEKK